MTLFSKLFRLHLLSPRGIYRFLLALWQEGFSLMAITRFTTHYYPNVVAVADEQVIYTYQTLHTKATIWANILYERGLNRGTRCALLGRNSSEMVIASLALSRIGVDLYYISTDLPKDQIVCLCRERHLSIALAQEEYADRIPNEVSLWSLEELCKESLTATHKRIPKGQKGRIIVLTGGSSGNYKTATRKPSVTRFLYPFFSLLRDIRLDTCQSVYIAPPLYHGFGLASLIVALIMGKTIYLRKRFDPKEATRLLSDHTIEVLIAVPLMIRRLLKESPDTIQSIRRILSGGAPLDESLVKAVEKQWGTVLYNLYGTSEAGFFVLATPTILQRYPLALGKPIDGVQCKIIDADQQGVGRLAVRSGWAMDDRKDNWQDTGDLAYMDQEGILFLKGRSDSMIVSGGENVYPEVLREAFFKLESVCDVVVISYSDIEFGARLAAFVVLEADSLLTEEELRQQLSAQLPRYQIPGQIVLLDALPRMENGKVSEVSLKAMITTN